jgi:hypothetical protein
MHIQQAQRILKLQAETLRMTKEAAQTPVQPIIRREDIDGLAAHMLA